MCVHVCVCVSVCVCVCVCVCHVPQRTEVVYQTMTPLTTADPCTPHNSAHLQTYVASGLRQPRAPTAAPTHATIQQLLHHAVRHSLPV